MAISRRTLLKTSVIGLAAARLSPGLRLPDSLMARSSQVKIGVTDWNLKQEGKLEAVALAKKIGFAGVEVSIGVGAERLPLSDKALQQQYVHEGESHKLPIASTCLNVLHKDVLKSDRLAQRWVADSIPITKNVGAKVILLPFFGKGSLKTQQEMDYVADYLKEVAPEAERAQVVLGIENTISAEDNARILDRAKSRAVLVYYDIGNSTNGGFDILKEIRWLGKERICQFHIKDNPYLLGKGRINIPAVVNAIVEIGYSGWAHLETHCPSGSVEADMSANLHYVRGLLS